MDETDIGDVPEPEGLRLKSFIGRGRRSRWFEAEQVRLNRDVALKYLLPHLAARPKVREAFLEAGRQAAGIVHPVALPIINVFPDKNCIVMQRCHGLPLAASASALDPWRVARIGETVLDCLASLHATGRCHGNLLPGNVFWDDKDGVWLNDFFQPPLWNADRTTGESARFLPPEVVHGGTSDWRSDIFALGRLLAAALVSEHDADELVMLLDAMQSEDPDCRFESPGAVLAAFGRIRRLEEARQERRGNSLRRGRRMYRRVPGEFDVALRRRSATPGETAQMLMKIRDIGESGVFVETSDDLIGIGSILELDFGLKGVEGNVHAFGVVRWTSSPPMPRGVGVQFVEVDQSGLVRLRKFLENR